MILFAAIVGGLTLVVVIHLVRPLLRSNGVAKITAQRLNASIYRELLDTLDREHKGDQLTSEEYEASRGELQLRLLDDEAEPPAIDSAPGDLFWTARRTVWGIAVALPLLSVGTYLWLGTPEAIDPVSTQRAQEALVEKMVAGLAARLIANPDDPKGWATLARSYKILGRLKESQDAYEHVGKLMESDPDMLASFADVLATRAGNNLQGRPLELITKALAIDPNHAISRMLAGTAAYQQGKFELAVDHWERLIPLMDPGSADAEQLAADIADARAKAGPSAPDPAKR